MQACQEYVTLVKNWQNKKNAGLEVVCIPGPCAAITALVSSGHHLQNLSLKVFFKKKTERDKTLLEKQIKTTIIFESPHRLKKLLQEQKLLWRF